MNRRKEEIRTKESGVVERKGEEKRGKVKRREEYKGMEE